MLVGSLNALPTRDPPSGWGGPRVQETVLVAETAPSKGGPELLGHREGGRSGCKPNTAGGSVGRARCRHRKVIQNLYTATWQSNIVGQFTPERPGTWADEGGWPSQGFLYGCFLFFLPKVEVVLKSRNNGLSGPTGVVPTLDGLQ